MARGSDTFGGLAVERGAQLWQVQVAAEPAEPLAGFEHAGAHQRSGICPFRQRLTFLACSRQIEIIDSIALVERSVRVSVGGTPSRRRVKLSGDPFTQAGGSAGTGRGQPAGQRLEPR